MESIAAKIRLNPATKPAAGTAAGLAAKRHPKRRLTFGWFAVYAVMILLLAFMALPLVMIYMTSLKPIEELLLFPPRVYVLRPTLNSFGNLFSMLGDSAVPASRFIFNSAVVTAASVYCTIWVSCMGAYAIEKIRMPGHRFIFRLVIWGLMFSPIAAQIPNYLMIKSLGLYNTYWALILPGIVVPMHLFLIKQFTIQIPDSIVESARIDGCSEFKVLSQIMMPMLRPAWTTVLVFAFFNSWNGTNNAIVYVKDQAMKTFPYFLSSISGTSGIARMGEGMAAAALMITPTIVVYLIMQKKVIDTMAYAGIKG